MAMSAANDQLVDQNETGMFVTVFAAVLDLNTGTVHYVNAGHNSPLLMRGDGANVTPLPLTKKSPLMGYRSGQSPLISSTRSCGRYANTWEGRSNPTI